MERTLTTVLIVIGLVMAFSLLVMTIGHPIYTVVFIGLLLLLGRAAGEHLNRTDR